jgi:transposase
VPNRIPTRKIKRLISIYKQGDTNKLQTAKSLKIGRTTLRKYLIEFDKISHLYPDVIQNNTAFLEALLLSNDRRLKSSRYQTLIELFPSITIKLGKNGFNLKKTWEKYKHAYPYGYGYSQFTTHYKAWRESNNESEILPNEWKIESIPVEDLLTLQAWRRSNDRRKWERAVVIMESNRGCHISDLVSKIERSRRKIIEWIKLYKVDGLKPLLNKRTCVKEKTKQIVKTKITRLIKLIHETPSLHGINRTSWSLKSLAQAYQQEYGESISKTMISNYVKLEGYSIKKAKKVLTSPDPEYRKKLQKITNILSHLGENAKFFSIDEYGPFSIKIQGGKALAKKGEMRSYPQYQKSKGSLICTAALELSTNQITHFYSSSKNTTEMIKLLEILLKKYSKEERIYFSWDAASWHASKELYNKVETVNNSDYRDKHKTPIVELAPLPVSAQFLNVIESVFSGMAKAIIHNSDYQSVDECKSAIDLYFQERNEYFKKHPKRAGNKIWGKEVVKPVFSETNNCKDPNWR